MCIFTIMSVNGDNIMGEDCYNFGLPPGNINIVHKVMSRLDQGNNINNNIARCIDNLECLQWMVMLL